VEKGVEVVRVQFYYSLKLVCPLGVLVGRGEEKENPERYVVNLACLN
jgi:hypothetical protein